jgi:hypothetical protein
MDFLKKKRAQPSHSLKERGSALKHSLILLQHWIRDIPNVYVDI